MADNDNTTNNAEGAFFVYMGVGGPSVPFDVVQSIVSRHGAVKTRGQPITVIAP